MAQNSKSTENKTNIHKGHREKVKNRYYESGLNSMPDHNILELLLFFGIPQKDTNPIAHELMNKFGSFSGVLEASKADLQSVKGMTAAEATVKKDGVIIMLSKCNDGTGGDHFFHQMAEFEDLDKIEEKFMARGRNETLADQWMTQILTRILKNSSVVYVSDAPDDMIKAYHMIPAHSLEEAMEKAYEILGNKDAKVTAIPDGVAVMVVK